MPISIHAPPRGATRQRCVPFASIDFNSRPSARGDRGASSIVKALASYFNSRPSARGDKAVENEKKALEISIHAPPRGATLASCQGLLHTPAFQFTPLREGRHADFPQLRNAGSNFNSRPSARGDGKRYAISATLLFNPYKSAWLNNSATQFVETILVIFHRIIA